jgi:cobalt-zinc-cadmium efflux system protein
MKSEKRIFVAFILNILFSVIEFIGGIFTGSYAIISDAIHDFGDGLSIGISYFLEKISKKKPDDSHTYGYLRYSVLGSVFTTAILIFGSLVVMYNALPRIISPAVVNYDGVIVFAVIGTVVNFVAAWYTHGKASLNQKAVNLHMLEDVLGWVVVLVGAALMKVTRLYVIDPILSVVVAVFIFVNATKNLLAVVDIFLEKTPHCIDLNEVKEHLLHIDGVLDVHHIHIRTIDGFANYATLHAVTDEDPKKIKPLIKSELREHGIIHTTVELEKSDEQCDEVICSTKHQQHSEHCHHHHHH